jgi:hypothetical protein
MKSDTVLVLIISDKRYSPVHKGKFVQSQVIPKCWTWDQTEDPDLFTSQRLSFESRLGSVKTTEEQVSGTSHQNQNPRRLC